MTDFRALCAELAEFVARLTKHYYEPAELLTRARAALTEADGPAVTESRKPASVAQEPSDADLLATLDKATATFPPRHPEAEGLNAVEYPLALELRKARAVLARWGNLPESPDSSDGPTVFNDRESASVMDQLKYQLFLKVKADLIREVINQALKDTASVHWRVTNTGEQIVRVGDLLRWAEQAANRMESAND